MEDSQGEQAKVEGPGKSEVGNMLLCHKAVISGDSEFLNASVQIEKLLD